MMQLEAALHRAHEHLPSSRQELKPSEYFDAMEGLCSRTRAKSPFDAYGVKSVLGATLVGTMLKCRRCMQFLCHRYRVSHPREHPLFSLQAQGWMAFKRRAR